MNRDHPSAEPCPLNDEVLHNWPLPVPSSDADKEQRGRVLIVGGSREIPGAILLAANAALHAGAGKVLIATGSSIALQMAIAVPESRVISLPENAEGSIMGCVMEKLDKVLSRIDAVLIGPGMQDEALTCRLVEDLLPKLANKKLILDAYAMGVACDAASRASFIPDSESSKETRTADSLRSECFLNRHDVEVLLTPHAGEMAHLTGLDKEAITTDPASIAVEAARRWNATIALKGGTTYIASPSGRLWQHEGGNIGLAVSGSGDTLAGIIVALAARGASLEQACAWGVALHARAGEQLAKRVGPMGYLARHLSAEVPSLMHQLSG
jgi:hydroxyethylthiazole kinase-like uncharacterized protein yjeF